MTRRWVAALLAGLCVGGAAQAAGTKVQIGYTPSADVAAIYVAKDRGLFEKHGLDVELVSVPVGANYPPLLMSGSLQIAEPTATTFLQAVDGGLDLIGIANVSDSSRDSRGLGVAVGPNSGIRTPADFRGKRIAVPALNALTHVIFRQWLLKNGVGLNDVSYVELPVTQHLEALQSKLVDGVVTFDPFLTRITDGGTGVLVSTVVSDFDPFSAAMFATTRAWADANRPTIEAFRAALIEATAIAKQDFAGLKPELKHYLKLPDSVIDIIKAPNYDPVLTVAQLEWWTDVMRQQGMLQSKVEAKALVLP